MKFPLAPTVQIAKYVAQQQRKHERYPLVLMLEPTLACNIACIGCGKIREDESNRGRLTPGRGGGPGRGGRGGGARRGAPGPPPGSSRSAAASRSSTRASRRSSRECS